MKICPLAEDKIGEFISFNQQINSTQNDFKAHFQWQILDNPLLKDRAALPILVAYNGNEEIVGQHPHNPFEYEYQGKRHIGYFGFDYYVAEKCRKMGIGSALFSRKALGTSLELPKATNPALPQMNARFLTSTTEKTDSVVRHLMAILP